MQQCTTKVSVISVKNRKQSTTVYNTVNCRCNKQNTCTTQVRDQVVEGNDKTPLQLYNMLQHETPKFKEFKYLKQGKYDMLTFATCSSMYVKQATRSRT